MNNLNQFNNIISPLDQFNIIDILSLNILNSFHISLTNIGLYLTIGCFFILIMSMLSTNYNKLVSNN